MTSSEIGRKGMILLAKKPNGFYLFLKKKWREKRACSTENVK